VSLVNAQRARKAAARRGFIHRDMAVHSQTEHANQSDLRCELAADPFASALGSRIALKPVTVI
jgi:hypothetical protein